MKKMLAHFYSFLLCVREEFFFSVAQLYISLPPINAKRDNTLVPSTRLLCTTRYYLIPRTVCRVTSKSSAHAKSTLRVLIFSLGVLIFTLRVLIFTLRVLNFTLRVLKNTLRVLKNTLRVLNFTLGVLKNTPGGAKNYPWRC